MPNYNKVILAGNLCAKPELRFSQGGTPWTNFSMAVNERYTNQKGELTEDVTFVDVSSFGKQAETITKYMDKGAPILVDGRLTFRKWEDKEGQKRSKLSVIMRSFQFLSRGDRAPAGEEPRSRRT